MTSKIIVNNIEADVGVSTITFGSNIQGNLIGNVTGTVNSSGIITASRFIGNVTGNLNSSGVSTITTLQTGAIQTVAGKPILNTTGSILQVVSTTKTNIFTSTSVSYVDITGLTATITPSSSSNKILVRVDLNGAIAANAGGVILRRNGSNMVVGDTVSGITNNATFNIYNGGDDSNGQQLWSMSHLDSPASTSALTYSVAVACVQGGGTIVVNDQTSQVRNQTYAINGVSNITVMEVSG
jgi:hypothetical protein